MLQLIAVGMLGGMCRHVFSLKTSEEKGVRTLIKHCYVSVTMVMSLGAVYYIQNLLAK